MPDNDLSALLAETLAEISGPDAGGGRGGARPAGPAHQAARLARRARGCLGPARRAGRPCPAPLPEPAAVAVFAADHGVHAQGVTPWPQEVTAQMVANFLAGGAVINAIATQAGAEVVVVDVGVAADLDAVPGLLARKVRPGTADMTVEPAMTRAAGARRDRGRHRGRPRPGRGRQPVPAHRRHGHRQHHRLRRADRRVHRARPGRGHRPRHRRSTTTCSRTRST